VVNTHLVGIVDVIVEGQATTLPNYCVEKILGIQGVAGAIPHAQEELAGSGRRRVWIGSVSDSPDSIADTERFGYEDIIIATIELRATFARRAAK
jgi:hypothetical protein